MRAKTSKMSLKLGLILLCFQVIQQLSYAQNCNGAYGNLDAEFSDCAINPMGTQVMTFNGVGNHLSMGVWMQIQANPTSTAYVLRLTLNPVNDASSDECKIVSIELVPPNRISIKFAGSDITSLLNRFNYEEAYFTGYSLNKWYWIYTARSQSALLLSQFQYVGIYDPQSASFVVTDANNWLLLYYLPNLASSGFKVFANGFQGYAQGFCGKLRGLAVMPGVSFSNFNTAYEYLGQKQGSGPSKVLLYMPFNSKTGQVTVDFSNSGYTGILGSTPYPDFNDPVWEDDLSKGIHFTSIGSPKFIQLPLLDFLVEDDSVTVSFYITLNSAPLCTAPIIQRKSILGEIVFGIAVTGSRTISLFINNVECPLGITLTLNTPTHVIVMCSTYGDAPSPSCKAYQDTSKVSPLTVLSSIVSLGLSFFDKTYIGDYVCGFNGYVKNLAIVKDGNILDISCSSCKLGASIDASGQFCLECPSSTVGSQGACAAACGSGFQMDPDTQECYCPPNHYINGNVCTACSPGCDGCFSSSPAGCYSCAASIPQLYLSSSTNTCVAACPLGTYASSLDFYCVPCDPACVGCTGAGNTLCTGGCQAGYYQQPAPDNSSCLNSCPSGSYPDDGTNACQLCDTKCQTCTGPSNTQCLLCATGFYLQPAPDSNTCLDNCPAGYYPNDGTKTCQLCNTNCLTCTGPSNVECIQCASGFYQQPPPNSNTCLNVCPSGYYRDNGTNTCKLCNASCQTCTGPSNTQCLICATGYYLLGATTCVTSTACPSGTFPDSSTYICQSCTAPCGTCSSATSCNSCVSNNYLQPAPNNSQCSPTCPSTHDADLTSGKCVPYPSYCTDRDTFGCLECQYPLYVYDSKCYIACPPFTYPQTVIDSSNYTCFDCDSSCQTCDGPGPQNCTLCKNGLYLFDRQCLLNCPSGTYGTKVFLPSGVAAPICAPKVLVELSLQLTIHPSQVLIRFSETVGTYYLKYFISQLRVTVQNTVIDNTLISAKIHDGALIDLTILARNYVPDGAILRVDLLLGPDFDNDPTSEFYFLKKYAEKQIIEANSYDLSQGDTISAAASLLQTTGYTTAAGQVAAIATSGGVASILIQFRMITDLIQLLQFLDISWPANVMVLFQESFIDPSNLCIPICVIPSPSDEQLPNITISRYLEAQEISPVFLLGACEIVSTFIFEMSVIFFLKVLLQFRKPKRFPQSLTRFGESLDKILAWNTVVQVFISNYPLFLAYSTLQLFYKNFETPFVSASFATSIVGLVACIGFITWIFVVSWKLSKHPANLEQMLKTYPSVSSLFEGIKNTKRMQIFQISFSLLRITMIAVCAVIADTSPYFCISLLCTMEVLYLTYLFKYRPFKASFEQWTVVLAEILVLSAFLCALGIKLSTDLKMSVDTRTNLGWGFISLSFGVSIITIIILAKQAIAIIKLGVRVFKSHLLNRKKIQPIMLNQESLTTQGQETNEVKLEKVNAALGNLENAQHLLRNGLHTLKTGQKYKPETLRYHKQVIENLLKDALKAVTDYEENGTSMKNSNTSIKNPGNSNLELAKKIQSGLTAGLSPSHLGEIALKRENSGTTQDSPTKNTDRVDTEEEPILLKVKRNLFLSLTARRVDTKKPTFHFFGNPSDQDTPKEECNEDSSTIRLDTCSPLKVEAQPSNNPLLNSNKNPLVQPETRNSTEEAEQETTKCTSAEKTLTASKGAILLRDTKMRMQLLFKTKLPKKTISMQISSPSEQQ